MKIEDFRLFSYKVYITSPTYIISQRADRAGEPAEEVEDSEQETIHTF